MEISRPNLTFKGHCEELDRATVELMHHVRRIMGALFMTSKDKISFHSCSRKRGTGSGPQVMWAAKTWGNPSKYETGRFKGLWKVCVSLLTPSPDKAASMAVEHHGQSPELLAFSLCLHGAGWVQ